ncbi:neuroligin [Sarotherodon galilaeus]
MSKTDMLTLMAMRWTQQKLDNLATSLTHPYQKATKALLSQLLNLESLKVQLAVTDSQLDDWVSDVKEWAEAATRSTSDADALVSRIKVLVASIKRASQRLYRDTDGNKRRAFDIIMAVRRLEEDKKIVVREMDHDWKSLSTYDDTLKEPCCLFSSCVLFPAKTGAPVFTHTQHRDRICAVYFS